MNNQPAGERAMNTLTNRIHEDEHQSVITTDLELKAEDVPDLFKATIELHNYRTAQL